jgi:hypothetical protein
MIPGHIEGANVCFKRPKDTTAEQCGDLWVRREAVDNHGEAWVMMTSAWIPTPEELAALNAGAAVILSIAGTTQPPVILTVSQPPPPIILTEQTRRELGKIFDPKLGGDGST